MRYLFIFLYLSHLFSWKISPSFLWFEKSICIYMVWYIDIIQLILNTLNTVLVSTVNNNLIVVLHIAVVASIVLFINVTESSPLKILILMMAWTDNISIREIFAFFSDFIWLYLCSWHSFCPLHLPFYNIVNILKVTWKSQGLHHCLSFLFSFFLLWDALFIYYSLKNKINKMFLCIGTAKQI